MNYREPLSFAAGDSFTFTKILSDYPASDGWSLSYVFLGPAKVTINGSADGDNHLVEIAVDSFATAGTYAVQGSVSKGSEKITVFSGQVTVTENLSAGSAGYDPRSHAQKVVDAIEAVIEGRADKDQQEMWVDGDKLVRTPFETLIEIRKKYRHEIANEKLKLKRKQGRKGGRTIKHFV